MTTVNRCLDAAKACNVDDWCQKLRTEYVSVCIKPTAKSGLCNRAKCNKALRKFFDRVPADYTHELLFCPCTDTACAERRRQTIVPSCSYESEEKPNCITQMRICNADYVCKLEQIHYTNTDATMLFVFACLQYSKSLNIVTLSIHIWAGAVHFYGYLKPNQQPFNESNGPLFYP